ncbi:MAG: ATP-binding protein, partial [Candidatus Binatota bacterium]
TYPEIATIVMASLERLAVVDEALRQGAWDFVIKQPDLSHLQEIPQAISRSAERKRLKSEIERYGDEAKRLQEENEQHREQAKRLQDEAERYQEEAKKLQADIEHYRAEAKRLQEENERYREEATGLRTTLEESRSEGQQETKPSLESPAQGPNEKASNDEVLADIAEDLKSPLAAMIGYLEIASAISPEQADASQILSLQRIEALARRLFDLVMNHTGALDIEAGRFELQKNLFEINGILESAVLDKKDEANTKNIEIILETANDLPPITADAVQLERAVKILISNAIGLSPLGGSVTVSSLRQDNEIAISVRDTGAGIFKEEFPLLFDRRKKIRRRGADVNTAGLFVAHHIVSAHGGRIDVQSDPLEGTTLTIALPI